MSNKTYFTWLALRALIFHWLLWLAYLSADFVATFVLGYLSQYEDSTHGSVGGGSTSPQNRTKHLVMFWAPFLLLHLGGQDTMTAFFMEDNELWIRHLLTLISQVGLAVYVYSKSNPREGGLWPAAIPMFIAGTVKYAERTWSLKQASMSGLWSSILNVPEPSPIHAKLMEELTSNNAAGLPAQTIAVRGRQEELIVDLESQTTSNATSEDDVRYSLVVPQAYRLFQMFKGLFVDLILSLESWEESQGLLKKLTSKEAYKVIEIELSLMYEMLYSKAAMLHTWYGCAFRAVTFVCILTCLCIFVVHRKSGFGQTEIVVTYMLLGGAVGLEIIGIFCIFVSAWTYGALKESGSFPIPGYLLSLVVKKSCLLKKSLWSNRMGQYSLITFSVKDKPCLRREIMKFVGLKGNWDKYRYTTYFPVGEDIKKLVIQELKNEAKTAVNEYRGQWALMHEGYYNVLSWSIQTEFDKSILVWHIATDLLFHRSDRKDDSARRSQIGQQISNYMLFLLIMRPFMLPVGIGQVRFEATCAEARNHFKRQRLPDDADDNKPRDMILQINTDFDPSATKDNGSMSVLFEGCKLAHQLLKEFENDTDRMWKLINAVWVEILCFAANKCHGQFHAKQLSKGGEFLTIVWMLVAHLGLGDQCKVEMNQVVKLVVQK